ncbi:hypothetical protein BJ944DRAFT_246752 [Cunninghamella echinulata]|nr:hypothetical protein BJ944DRAFT_246752 [Cunninghamella echinulata]
MTTTSYLPSSEKLYHNNLYTANDIPANTFTLTDSVTLNQLKVLSQWINFKIEHQVIDITKDNINFFINNEYIIELVNKICPGLISLDNSDIENNKNNDKFTTTQNDHLSHVAQIFNVLSERDDGHIIHSTLVNKLEQAIVDNNVELIFEFISWIALKLSLNNILLDDNIKSYAFQLNDDFTGYTTQSTIPKFQLHDLSFHHIFLDIRRYLLIWVNWQLKICTDDIGDNFVPILDFGNSWKNGLAFALLIYCFNKNSLSDDLQTWIQQTIQNTQLNERWISNSDNKDTRTILSTVFNISNKCMNIPIYLQPEDLLDESPPNEWCIILYVYEFYQHFLKKLAKTTVPELDVQKNLASVVENISRNVNNNHTIIPPHPLDHPSKESVNLYIQRVSEARSLWEEPKLEDIKLKSTLDANSQTSTMNDDYENFKLGIDFVKISDAIQYELQIIKDMMNHSAAQMNNDIIQQLVKKIGVVKSSIYGLKEEFSTLLVMQEYNNHFLQVKNQYELVDDWINQVNVWVTEAETIKDNIFRWISLIKQRNSTTDKFDINALEIMDISIFNDLNIMEIHTEHEQLKKEIKQYDNNNIKHFYDHVNKQTNTQQNNSSPADTIASFVVSNTLNILNELFQLVDERSFWIDCLVDRLKWEHVFDKSVKWIASMDSHLDYFFRHQALWCQQDNDFDMLDTSDDREILLSSTYENKENAEKIITTLVELEQSISNFDHSSFTEVLNAYQEMEAHIIDNKNNNHLPQYLEQRQSGFESAFDDLMKRCTLSRKVVEQRLIMMDVATQFKNIKYTGESLRRRLLVANDGLDDTIMGTTFSDNSNKSVTSRNSDNKTRNNSDGDGDDGDDDKKNGNGSSSSIETCVQSFKASSADFITNVKSRIPFPDVPEMATAMGSTDAQDVTTTNDAIRSTIHTCGMTLALLADGLEQLLMERQHIQSLQQRTRYACEQLSRFTVWMEDRKQLLIKSDFDLYKYIGNDENDGDFTLYAVEDKNEEILSLEKERDNIASRLQQIEQEDLDKLLESVSNLELEIDKANAVSVDRHSIVNTLERLETTKLELNSMLLERSNKLESLKKYLAWKSHWIKTHQWVSATARKLWDFCMKKAMFDLQVEDINKPVNDHEREMTVTLNSYQDRINDASDKQIKNLSDLYEIMVDEMNKWELGPNGDSVNQLLKDQIVIDFTSKQSIVIQKYRSLMMLLQYASKLINQRSAIILVLQQIHEANREGERIRDNIIKATRRISECDVEHVNNTNNNNNNNNTQQQQQPNLHQRAEQFKIHINEIWNKNVVSIIYPVYSPKCNDPSFCSLFLSTQIQQKQQTEIKTLLKNKMDQLKKLDSTFTELLETYDRISKRKELVMEYSMNALELDQWIQTQIISLKKRHIDVSLETIDILNERSWNDLDQQHKQFIAMINAFEIDKLQPLHSKITSLVNEELSVNQQKQQNTSHSYQSKQRKSMDIALTATQHLGNAINNFSTLKQEIKDEDISLNAVAKRIEWAEALQNALSKLEVMQDRLIAWSKHKDEWVEYDIDSTGDYNNHVIEENMLKNLVDELESIINDKDDFITSVLPNVYELYDTFIECFSNLPRPMATPDHIEVKMNSLTRSKNRFQESLSSKTKELDILQECRRWDSKWKLLWDDMNNNTNYMGLFATNRARWNDDSPNDDGFYSQLIKDAEELQQRCYAQKKVDELKDQLDRVTEDILMNNMSDTISKKMSTKFTRLDALSNFTSNLSSFLDMVINQHGLVRDLCLQLKQLESDLITTVQLYNTNHIEEDKDKSNSKLSIIQHRDEIKNSDNNGPNVDILANNLIKETLNNGITRLNHSLSELGQLLAHEKKVLQDESYQEYSLQLSSVAEWISTQMTKLNDIKAILENVASQLFIKANEEDVTEDVSTEKCYATLSGTSTTINDIQHLLQSNQHLISELNLSHCNWMDLFDDSIHLIEPSPSFDSQATQNTYKEILTEWDELHKTTERLKDQIQNLYMPTLLDRGLLQLGNNIKSLEFDMNSQHYSLISDDHLNKWSEQLNYAQKEYAFLNNKFYVNTETATNSIIMIEKDIERVNSMYRVLDKNSKGWQKTQRQQQEAEHFFIRVTDVIKDSTLLCEDISKANFSDGGDYMRLHQIQWSNQHKIVKEKLQELETTYHDILSSLLISPSTNITLNTFDEFILNHQKELKSQINKSWHSLQQHTALIVRNFSIFNKWAKLYTELKDSRQVLLGCKTTLETMTLHKSKILNNKDYLQSNQSAIIDNVDRQLNTVLPWLKNLNENIDPILINNQSQYEAFIVYYENSMDLGNRVQTLLHDYYKTKECSILYKRYQDTIDQRTQQFVKHLFTLKKYNKLYQNAYNDWQQLNEQQFNSDITNNIRSILNSHQADIEHAQDFIMEFKDDLADSGEIGKLCDSLISKYNQPYELLMNEKSELIKTMEDLDSLINWQLKWQQFITIVDIHISNNTKLLKDIDQLYYQLFNMQDINGTAIQNGIQQYKILEITISTFVTFENYHKQHKYNFSFIDHSQYEGEYKLWLELISNNDEQINKKWDDCTDIYNNIQHKLNKSREQQQHIAILDGVVRQLNDMKIRVDSLRLSGQNITVEHQELKDINDEYKQIIDTSLENLLKNYQYHDVQSIQQRHLELSQLKDTINSAIIEKQKKAKKQENAVQLMDYIKKLENITDSVDIAIEDAAPYHARMENGVFVKSDLQELLKKFIKDYKQHAQSIDKVYKIIEEKVKTKIETSEIVDDLLISWKQRWKNSKASAGIRERELQSCIGQLQHDFFTKLALVNKNKKVEKQNLQQQPLYSSSSTTTTLYSYENDNQNELDVQLKRIVKDQASRLKVRTVPGQVGKYWFGNSNRRLVYCRILQSKMVMVRVGGGWVELSKFLLEHGCKEGIKVSDSEANRNSRFTETYITVERCLSPSGRITIRGGGAVDTTNNENGLNPTPSRTSSKTSISSRCKSPVAGFMDGDRFIRIDESGNHLAIKMVRADEDSFVPYHPHSKTLYQW